MNAEQQFYILATVSCLVYICILHYVMRHRIQVANVGKLIATAAIVVFGGMLFARYGAQSGLPWWIYYTVPMLLTVFLPPLVFSMSMREVSTYVVMALLSAPIIHVVFSFFFGWRVYMPFLHVPSLQDLMEFR